MKEPLTLIYKLHVFETLPSDNIDKKSKFELFLNGDSIGFVASPIHDGARLLLKLGYDPETLLTTRSDQSQHASWKPQTLAQWAKLSTQELDHLSVRNRSFTAIPRVGTSEGFSASQVSTYQNDMSGLKTPSHGHAEATL